MLDDNALKDTPYTTARSTKRKLPDPKNFHKIFISKIHLDINIENPVLEIFCGPKHFEAVLN